MFVLLTSQPGLLGGLARAVLNNLQNNRVIQSVPKSIKLQEMLFDVVKVMLSIHTLVTLYELPHYHGYIPHKARINQSLTVQHKFLKFQMHFVILLDFCLGFGSDRRIGRGAINGN